MLSSLTTIYATAKHAERLREAELARQANTLRTSASPSWVSSAVTRALATFRGSDHRRRPPSPS